MNPPITESPTVPDAPPSAVADTDLKRSVPPDPSALALAVPESLPPVEPAGPDAAAVGAPFDPCRIVGWADFPASVRSDDPRNVPTVMAREADDVYATGCRFNNSSEATIVLCGPPGCPDDAPRYDIGDLFIGNVLWGEDINLDPDHAPHPNRAASIRGHRALIIPGTNEAADNAPSCGISFQLPRGVGAVTITDGRFGTDPCTIARIVAAAVITRAG